MSYGKKIELFLVKGTPSGLRKAKIVNWSGECFAAYRSNISDFLNREELKNNPGVYFLIGINEDTTETAVYVGETENIAERIKAHFAKEFWNQCIAFISSARNLNKAHVRWLEGSIYQDLKEAGQIIIMNENKPSGSHLSEADEAVMMEFKDHLYLILGTLGFMGINEGATKSKEKTSLYDYSFLLTRNNELLAKMIPIPTGYKLLKGAKLRPDKEEYRNNRSLRLHYQRRDLLREKQSIIQENNIEILNENQVFQSSSGASSFVLGGTSNGRTDWKTEDGKTLKQIEELYSEID